MGHGGTFDIRKSWVQRELSQSLSEGTCMSDDPTLGLSVSVCEMGLTSEATSHGVDMRITSGNARECSI